MLKMSPPRQALQQTAVADTFPQQPADICVIDSPEAPSGPSGAEHQVQAFASEPPPSSDAQLNLGSSVTPPVEGKPSTGVSDVTSKETASEIGSSVVISHYPRRHVTACICPDDNLFLCALGLSQEERVR